MVGTTYERYPVQSELGCGGMGMVLRARGTKLDGQAEEQHGGGRKDGIQVSRHGQADADKPLFVISCWVNNRVNTGP